MRNEEELPLFDWRPPAGTVIVLDPVIGTEVEAAIGCDACGSLYGELRAGRSRDRLLMVCECGRKRAELKRREVFRIIRERRAQTSPRRRQSRG